MAPWLFLGPPHPFMCIHESSSETPIQNRADIGDYKYETD